MGSSLPLLTACEYWVIVDFGTDRERYVLTVFRYRD